MSSSQRLLPRPTIGKAVIDGIASSLLYVDENGNLAQDNSGLGYDEATQTLTVQNLIVPGDFTFGDASTDALTVHGKFIQDLTDTEAFLIRKDADGGDVFVVDTTNTRVGIGTATPSSSLQVVGDGITSTNTSGAAILRADRTDGKIGALVAGNSTVLFGYDSLGDFAIQGYSRSVLSGTSFTTPSEFLVQGSTGYVGIGTASPTSRLHVSTADSVNSLTLARTGTYGGTNTSSQILFQALGVNVGVIAAVRNGGNDAGALTFSTRAAAGAIAEHMRITSTGNVGIGITAPETKLHIRKDSSTAYSTSLGRIGSTDTLILDNQDASAGFASIGFRVLPAAQVESRILGISGGGSRGAIAFQTRRGSTTLDEAMRISSDLVMIGTTSQGVGSARLTVDGSVDIGAGNALLFGATSTRLRRSSSSMLLEAAGDIHLSAVGLVAFNGSSNSHPALKRVDKILQVRLADDSAYTELEAGTLRTARAYTVATLPTAGTQGRFAYVTDALAPTFLGTLTGGGTVVTPVFDNGTAWVAI